MTTSSMGKTPYFSANRPHVSIHHRYQHLIGEAVFTARHKRHNPIK
jgi:hypothetical protein